MGMWVGRGRKARRCYGFDEIALVPGDVTINPDEVDCSWTIKDLTFQVPILAAAMDGTTGLPGLGSYPAAPADPLGGFDGARSVVWSPDGKNLYCGAGNSNTVSVFQEW